MCDEMYKAEIRGKNEEYFWFYLFLALFFMRSRALNGLRCGVNVVIVGIFETLENNKKIIITIITAVATTHNTQQTTNSVQVNTTGI